MKHLFCVKKIVVPNRAPIKTLQIHWLVKRWRGGRHIITDQRKNRKERSPTFFLFALYFFSWFPPHCFPYHSCMVDFLLFPLLKSYFLPISLHPSPPLSLFNCCPAPIPPSYNLVFFGSLISCSNKHTGPQDTSRKLLNVITAESGLHAIYRGLCMCYGLVCSMVVCVKCCGEERQTTVFWVFLLSTLPRMLSFWFSLRFECVCQQYTEKLTQFSWNSVERSWHGPRKNKLKFGADQNHRADTLIIFIFLPDWGHLALAK